MTRRTPAEYDWTKLEFDEQLLTKHFSPLGSRTIKYVVVHHMTIVGDGDGSALDTVYDVWQKREASAHYGVDGVFVGQFVWDKDFAWATGSAIGNLEGVSIEHANQDAAPTWLVSSETFKTGAKLAGYLHHAYKMGRPVKDKTVRKHSSFTATACPGPYMDSNWSGYVAEAQRVYDALVNGLDPGATPEPTPVPTPTPAKTLTDYAPSDFGPGKVGPQVTLLGQRLVAHGYDGAYTVGPGPSWGDADRRNVAAFQRAQGWTGSDADGYPGPETLRRLDAEPKPKPETVEVVSAIQNMAGNNAHGIKTAKARMARYVAARKATPVHVINAQETTVASTVRPRLDFGLKPLGYKRAGGGMGRYCYTRGIKVIDAGMFTVPSKLWYRRDNKQAAWVAYEIDGALGMDVSIHLESDPGATADNLRVEQALWIETAALVKAKALQVPEQNVMLAGDTNSEGMVLAALVKAGWRNAAVGTGYENTHTFMGWDGRSRKRFDYAFVRADAAAATVEALAHDTSISDHAGLRVVRQLIK